MAAGSLRTSRAAIADRLGRCRVHLQTTTMMMITTMMTARTSAWAAFERVAWLQAPFARAEPPSLTDSVDVESPADNDDDDDHDDDDSKDVSVGSI